MFRFPYYSYINPYSYPFEAGAYGGFSNYNFGVNAFQSQIANQSLINTGTMAGVNQVFSPTQIW
jgi:hypothetical protein